ncbi:hypothetical protein LSAT2_009855 [Lamellibrachia satsuma]|nr:hypothetical protein LSAT2_009855 [Lamellibrachia satsuma]
MSTGRKSTCQQKTALTWTPEGNRKRVRQKTTWRRTRRTEGCWVNMGHITKEILRQKGLSRSCESLKRSKMLNIDDGLRINPAINSRRRRHWLITCGTSEE